MPHNNSLPKNTSSKKLARNLRKNATKEENHLWYDFLKTYPVQFHRQYVIENYIVDFFCPKAQIVIELDGSQHYEPKVSEYDKTRTNEIAKYGFMVLRYTNIEINQQFDAVCADIHRLVVDRIGYDPFLQRQE